MKKFLGMLMCAVAVFAFAACSDDDDKDDPVIKDGVYSYIGDIVVDQTDGTFFTDKDVQVDLTFNKEDKTVKMVVNKVKFAENMPVEIDMTVDGLTYAQYGDELHIVGTYLVPTAMGGPFPAYEITGFGGRLQLDEHDAYYGFSTYCGKFPVKYDGRAL